MRPRIRDRFCLVESASCHRSPVLSRRAITFSIVTDGHAVRQVALGADGVLSGIRPGDVYVDMGTIAPDVTRSVAAAFATSPAPQAIVNLIGGYTPPQPLSGLDVTSALIFKNLVQALGRAGKLVFYCSHVLEVVEKVCTDVLILRKGVVIAHDSVENLGKILGESLENTFLHLVDDVDTVHVARDIVDVMKAA